MVRAQEPRNIYNGKSAARDLTAGFRPVNEAFETGVRGIHGCCLLTFVLVLWILAVGTLACNVLLIRSLQMNVRGIPWLQLVRSDNGTPIVQFLAKTYMPELKAKRIGGFWGNDLVIDANKILIRGATKSKQDSSSKAKPTSIEIKGRTVQVRGPQGFAIHNSANQLVFDASSPALKLPKGVRKLAAHQIMTNKIRSPVNRTLRIDVNNLSFRGNEGNFFNAQNIRVRGRGIVNFEAPDNGAIHMRGGTGRAGGVFISAVNTLPVSTSPHLSASVLAYRLCSCRSSGRVFLMDGNHRCALKSALCY